MRHLDLVIISHIVRNNFCLIIFSLGFNKYLLLIAVGHYTSGFTFEQHLSLLVYLHEHKDTRPVLIHQEVHKSLSRFLSVSKEIPTEHLKVHYNNIWPQKYPPGVGLRQKIKMYSFYHHH